MSVLQTAFLYFCISAFHLPSACASLPTNCFVYILFVEMVFLQITVFWFTRKPSLLSWRFIKVYTKWILFSSNKLNKVHMNIKLLVWFVRNDFKFVFFYRKVRVRTGQKWLHFRAAKTIKLQGRDVGNCTQRGWAKGSYCVVGGSNKVSCKNINVYARHIYALLPKRRSHSSKMDSLCSQTPERFCSF